MRRLVPVLVISLLAVVPLSAPTATAAAPASAAAQRQAATVLLEAGDHGPWVRALQARLRAGGWFSGDVTSYYGVATEAGVRRFQRAHSLAVSGRLTRGTWSVLRQVTEKPGRRQLRNEVLPRTNVGLDRRCRTGRVLCVDKTSLSLRWVVNGTVRMALPARFGASTSPTREGVFTVYWKSRDHVSSLYGSSMPYAMFFSGGQAVHYSADFASVGYAGASHGCVNIRNRAAIARLFDLVREGDKVVVYRG